MRVRPEKETLQCASGCGSRPILRLNEYRAELGRAVELLIQGDGAARPLSESLETIDTPDGRRQVAEYLEGRPSP